MWMGDPDGPDGFLLPTRYACITIIDDVIR
jgi:hypothetical protein